jgi:hypothetical protein
VTISKREEEGKGDLRKSEQENRKEKKRNKKKKWERREIRDL